MARTASLLLLALGASASMPAMPPQLMNFVEDIAARRLDGHDGGMPGFMSPECVAECPGAGDVATALMTTIAEAMQTTPPPDAPTMPPVDAQAMMMQTMIKILCDHEEALTCMAKTSACGRRLRRLENATDHDGHDHEETGHDGHDHEEESGGDDGMNMAMIPCLCACPDMGEMGMVGAAIEAGGGVLPKETCTKIGSAMGCMASAPACAPVAAAMDGEEDVTAIAMACDGMQGALAKAGVKVKPPPPFVAVSFKVEGVNLTDLSEKQSMELKATYAISIAEAAGVDPKMVKVMLSSGSIKVDAKVMAKDESAVAAKLAAPEAKAAMAKATTESTVLKEVVEAKGGSVDDLVVGDIAAEVETPTLPPTSPPATTTTAAAEDPPATTDSALAQVAPGLAMVAAIIAF